MDEFLSGVSSAINNTFDGPLQAFFHPINNVFIPAPEWIWKACAVGLFFATMLWVCAILKKEYVNLDQPKSGILYDLRLWTVLSMAPHVIVYIVF